jgi:hypothetical protein
MSFFILLVVKLNLFPVFYCDCEKTLNLSFQKADKMASAINKSASKKADLNREIAAISEKLQGSRQKIDLKETQIKESEEKVSTYSFYSHQCRDRKRIRLKL